MAETKRSSGIVKWFSAQKGFGFIAPDDGGEDLFVHQTSIKSEGFRTLSEGQAVEFSVYVGEDDRTKAVDVEAISRSRRFGNRGWRVGGFYGGRGRGGRGGGGGSAGSGACFNCGRTGHLARECYSRDGGGGGGRGYDGGRSGGGRGYDGGRGGGGRGYGGGRGGGGCYNCGEEGHFARDCPTNE